MSTPTAAGETAPRMAITLPTVAPIPRWQSGIARTPCTQGREAMFRSCATAALSASSGGSHILTGAAVSARVIGSWARSGEVTDGLLPAGRVCPDQHGAASGCSELEQQPFHPLTAHMLPAPIPVRSVEGTRETSPDVIP